MTKLNLLKTEYLKIKKDIIILLSMCGEKFHIEKDLLNAIISSSLNLIEAYIELHKINKLQTTITYELAIISITCFWICQKFHDDFKIAGIHLERITKINYNFIKNQEIQIMKSLNFQICSYMEGERPCLKENFLYCTEDSSFLYN